MLIDNFTYCISHLDKCIRAATCKVCVQPHSFASADSCCGSFGEVKTLFCLETKAYLDEGVFVALQTLNLGRKRLKIPPPPPSLPNQGCEKGAFSTSRGLPSEILFGGANH